jgi:hypothetical protein
MGAHHGHTARSYIGCNLYVAGDLRAQCEVAGRAVSEEYRVSKGAMGAQRERTVKPNMEHRSHDDGASMARFRIAGELYMASRRLLEVRWERNVNVP